MGAATTLFGVPTPAVSTPWLAAQAYIGRCQTVSGANVLMITGMPGAPELHAIPDASWGLHLVDANIAMGHLVGLAARQAQTYIKKHRR
jgi:hypothetical protein